MQKKNPESQLKRRDYVTWPTVADKKAMHRFAKRQKGLALGTWLVSLAFEEKNFIEQEKIK